jgi:hypothetical protein
VDVEVPLNHALTLLTLNGHPGEDNVTAALHQPKSVRENLKGQISSTWIDDEHDIDDINGED